MPAYVILIRNKTIDAEELKAYGRKAGPAGRDFAPKVLAYNGALDALEGGAAEGVVLIQFEDMAQARAWYDSPAYQDAKQHRLKGADYRVILTEGLAG
ncbi:MAG TPA: DUF1330 domain-containing protein [Caulobacteraceae bacterium]